MMSGATIGQLACWRKERGLVASEFVVFSPASDTISSIEDAIREHGLESREPSIASGADRSPREVRDDVLIGESVFGRSVGPPIGEGTRIYRPGFCSISRRSDSGGVFLLKVARTSGS